MADSVPLDSDFDPLELIDRLQNENDVLRTENMLLHQRLDRLALAEQQRRMRFSDELQMRLARIRVPPSEQEHFRKFLKLLAQMDDQGPPVSLPRAPATPQHTSQGAAATPSATARSASPPRGGRSQAPERGAVPHEGSAGAADVSEPMIAVLSQEINRQRDRLKLLTSELKRERDDKEKLMLQIDEYEQELSALVGYFDALRASHAADLKRLHEQHQRELSAIRRQAQVQGPQPQRLPTRGAPKPPTALAAGTVSAADAAAAASGSSTLPFHSAASSARSASPTAVRRRAETDDESAGGTDGDGDLPSGASAFNMRARLTAMPTRPDQPGGAAVRAAVDRTSPAAAPVTGARPSVVRVLVPVAGSSLPSGDVATAPPPSEPRSTPGEPGQTPQPPVAVSSAASHSDDGAAAVPTAAAASLSVPRDRVGTPTAGDAVLAAGLGEPSPSLAADTAVPTSPATQPVTPVPLSRSVSQPLTLGEDEGSAADSVAPSSPPPPPPPPPGALASLQCLEHPAVLHFMTESTVSIGRTSAGSRHEPGFMDLGSLCKRVSHLHCRIFYQADERRFVLENAGRNGVRVGGVVVTGSLALTGPSDLGIGSLTIRFTPLLPVFSAATAATATAAAAGTPAASNAAAAQS